MYAFYYVMKNIETGNIQYKRGLFDNHVEFLKLMYKWNLNQPKTYVYWETLEFLIPTDSKIYLTNHSGLTQ